MARRKHRVTCLAPEAQPILTPAQMRTPPLARQPVLLIPRLGKGRISRATARRCLRILRSTLLEPRPRTPASMGRQTGAPITPPPIRWFARHKPGSRGRRLRRGTRELTSLAVERYNQHPVCRLLPTEDRCRGVGRPCAFSKPPLNLATGASLAWKATGHCCRRL